MSSSASLVCAITDTKLYDNIRGMLRSALLPFLLTIAGYLILSRMHRPASVDTELTAELASAFVLRWPAVLPCAAILLLSLFRIDVKLTMAVSIGLSVLVGALVQGLGVRELLRAAFLGYCGRGAAALFTGGGIMNMLHVACIVCCRLHSGLVPGNGLLAGFRRQLTGFLRLSPYVSAVLVSFPVAAVSCNQNLGIMLTGQLCRSSFPDGGDAALAIEDSVVLTAALIPWNVAAAAPMAHMGIGPGCLKYALFLYLLPLLRCIISLCRQRADRRAPVRHGWYHLK
jgi:NhaC family Na+:H+ antiporter